MTKQINGFVVEKCPFCGEKEMLTAQVFTVQDTETNTMICCGNCGANGPNELNLNRAAKMWNMRRENKPGQS